MVRDEARQVALDFTLTPELVGRYVHHTPRSDALETARQVTVVTHYLSKMATGEARINEGAWYGTAIVCLDEVTDELGGRLSDGRVRAAFEGMPESESLEILSAANEVAYSDDFEWAVRNIAEWQDKSLEQFEDPGYDRLVEITRKKGGYSGLANLHMVKEDPTDAERDFMFEFGFVMQLLDDYLDRPKDEKEGISTLFTEDWYNVTDLCLKRDQMMDQAEDLWGGSKASKRFRRILNAHTLLGDIENTTRFSASTFVPFYL